VNSAQTAFASLVGVFTVVGAVLIDRGSSAAGWPLLALAMLAFIMLGWMIVSSALSRR